MELFLQRMQIENHLIPQTRILRNGNQKRYCDRPLHLNSGSHFLQTRVMTDHDVIAASVGAHEEGGGAGKSQQER